MPTYRVQTVDPSGRERSVVIDAESRDLAISQAYADDDRTTVLSAVEVQGVSGETVDGAAETPGEILHSAIWGSVGFPVVLIVLICSCVQVAALIVALIL